ncbi:hypothetical protein H2248_010798 [Termitomyces sp. 'cryptogamus']|nr:hypothetical protein H2248_010798 [Termitomyces sp. 'cryptogamus']
MTTKWEVSYIVVDGKGKLLSETSVFLARLKNPQALAYDLISIKLWKPNKDIDAGAASDKLEEIINGLSFNANSNDVERLIEVDFVSKYWNTAPNRQLIQVIAQAAHAVNLWKRSRSAKEDIAMLAKCLKTVTGTAPSSLVQPTKFQTVLGEDKLITINRPYETSTIPIALYERAFGIFRDRCKQLPLIRL